MTNVKKRVEQMCGGSMTVQSETGIGTTVTLRIPAASAIGRRENRA